jgi:SPP1 family predicted phage head-tail adaptor
MPSATREFAGTLNIPVTLEQPSETSGDAVVTWTVVGTDFVDMRGLGGSELSGLQAESNYHVRLRYRSDITARWRIGIAGTSRKLQVIGPPQDPTGRRQELLVMAREIV